MLVNPQTLFMTGQSDTLLHLSRFRSPLVTRREPLQWFVISCIHQATCSALSEAYSAYASKLVSSTYRIPIRVNTIAESDEINQAAKPFKCI